MEERPLLNTQIMRNLMEAEARGYPIPWGNLATMNQGELAAYGYYGALEREARRRELAEAERNWYAAQEASMRRAGSERLESSGYSSGLNLREIRAKVPRAKRVLRREHYRRKAELEAKKEAARMAEYEKRGLRPEEREKLEAARKTRKAAERKAREEAKQKIRAFLTRKARK